MSWLSFVILLLSFQLLGCKREPSVEPVSQDVQDRPYVVAFGDSLTEGKGLDEQHSYPGLLQRAIKVQGLPYEVKNEGNSGDTTADALKRSTKMIEKLGADNIRLVLLAFGGNDGLQNLSITKTRENLTKLIEQFQNQDIPVLLIGIHFSRTGLNRSNRFEGLYQELANQHDVHLVPDLLNGVAMRPKLNQADGIHPNKKGMKKVFETIWPMVKAHLTAQ